jgi:hypothetical protein
MNRSGSDLTGLRWPHGPSVAQPRVGWADYKSGTRQARIAHRVCGGWVMGWRLPESLSRVGFGEGIRSHRGRSQIDEIIRFEALVEIFRTRVF